MNRATVTVYCDAASHPNRMWERDYSREDDADHWRPSPFDWIGGFGTPNARVRKTKRSGGLEHIDAAGRPVPIWDAGGSRKPNDDHKVRLRRLTYAAQRAADWNARARAAANVGEEDELPLGRRYTLRCPECGDALDRNTDRLTRQLNWAVEQGFTRVTLDLLRRLDTLL
ncbi:hypothetical protein P6281_16365 [Mycobacterium sp. 5-140-3-2]|uniref:hypothetical protein n=1 Tax=Mycobacterium TaxID=1763 RepID=UPI001915B727|nr:MULTISPECIES: hypothetical protein [Mycobacterium]WRU80665.1 hypothetical protein P6281_16365 [Mycobacterium sp. 5-140-3-2]WSE43182.1 hypothetical protein QGN28_09755 [Mycobacterium sp. 5-140-3-1]WVL46127.1 hypothetical protein KN248_012195 [Mycobacterium paraintracellulare]BCP05897.1 hypothetical protein MINTM019_33530 [Mycobacterium paraintracellulare]BCP11025.1 hypothetical protein MINTM020_31230 [Mycobacterium paraintracellulare]